jgi:Transposase DDE domain
MLGEICGKYFSEYGKIFCKNIFCVLESIIGCCSSNTAEIAQQMGKQNSKPFDTNEKTLYRLLTSSIFQIDDKFWRCYLKMIFSFLENQKIIQQDHKVFLQVDFTSNTDNFLILCASIRCKSRAIPLYFSMRRYPQKANMIDQKKMELAFLKALKHALSKKYKYVIVADRGFGNSRFIENCQNLGFDYLIRLTTNKKILNENGKFSLSDLRSRKELQEINVTAWKKNVHIIKTPKTKEKEGWCLATSLVNLTYTELVEEYKRRFKIEKVFQDLKSSGFDLESSKIKKYDRYKRIFCLSAIAHALMVLVGNCIDENIPELKKRSLLCVDVLLAYSKLPKGLSLYISEKH